MMRMDIVSVDGNVRIYLHNERDTIDVFIGHNAFQSAGYNYVRNALTGSGSFVPVDEMVMTHGAGTSTVTPNNVNLGTGVCKFEGIWPDSPELTTITRFELVANSTTYSRLNVAEFDKLDDYTLTVEWTVSFS